MNTHHHSQLLWRYVALEREVQTLINSKCGQFCELCSARCCRADICAEAFESPFLRWIHQHEQNNLTFSEHHGWLNEKGCSLAIGRPPVCYEFFCDDLISAQPGNRHRYILRLLGKLISYVGQHALGNRHLVEISHESDLQSVSFERLKKRINAARSALEHIRFFYENGFFDDDAATQFEPILPLPDELA